MTSRIAVGPQQGRKAFMIRTIRPLDRPNPGLERVAKANGFSLHAGVSCEGHQKDKRERLCRYIARQARSGAAKGRSRCLLSQMGTISDPRPISGFYQIISAININVGSTHINNHFLILLNIIREEAPCCLLAFSSIIFKCQRQSLNRLKTFFLFFLRLL